VKIKLLSILLLCCLTVVGFAQSLSGEYKNDGRSTGSYYTNIKWDVSYNFEEKNGNFYIKFFNPKISVPNYSRYHDEFKKEYSLADLGLSQWPNARQLPFAMSVKANVSDGYNNYEVTASCNADFTCGDNYIVSKANVKNVTLQNFRVTGVTYFRANLGGEPSVDNILKNKRQSANATSNSNTLATSSTSTMSNGVATSSDANRATNSVSNPTSSTQQTQSSGGRTTAQNSNANQPWTRTQVDEYLERGAASRRAQEQVIQQKTAVVTNVIDAVGNYFADKAEQKRLASERALYAEIAADDAKIARQRAENDQKKQFRTNRTALVNSFNGGKVPLSSQKVEVDELYYFCFSFDHAAIDSPNMTMYVSNVFPITRYSDGTWPFTTTLLDNIARANNGAKVELSGFYTSQENAEQKRQEFIQGINDLSLKQETLTYKGNTSNKVVSTNNKEESKYGKTINLEASKKVQNQLPKEIKPSTKGEKESNTGGKYGKTIKID